MMSSSQRGMSQHGHDTSSAHPPVLGVSEVALSVADLPGMEAFYREVMGFELHSQVSLEGAVEDPDGDPTISFLSVSDTDTPLGRNGHPQMLVLIDYRRHHFAREQFDGHAVRQSTLNHLAFEIAPEDFERHRAHLHGLGVETSETSFPALGARALFFSDPEGNVLELICRA